MRYWTNSEEGLLLPGAPVLEVDGCLPIEERLVAEPVLQGGVVEVHGLEHLGIRPEGDLGAVPLGLSDDLHGPVGDADPVGLPPDLVLPVDRRHEPLGEGVDHGDSHAVQSAGDLVAVLVELPSGVEVGEAHLEGGLALLVVDPRGDAPPVVQDRDGTVLVDRDADLGGEPRHDLVDSVVHDLVDHVVQSARVGGPDVHAGPLPDGLESVQRDDAVRAVVLLGPFEIPILRIHRRPEGMTLYNTRVRVRAYARMTIEEG